MTEHTTQVAAPAYFGRDFFRFLAELARHNERPWFQANKTRFESDVRDPLLRFVADLAAPLHKVSSHFVVDPRPVGGSVMRIYRDIRFARDKSPYKTSMSAHFWHRGGRDESAPAFYLHLGPSESAVGGGIWRPETPTLKKIRDAIVREPKEWQRVTSRKAFGSSCGMAGESLKRVPAGYDPDHPLAQDLKRKDFAVSAPIAERDVTDPEFLETVARAYWGFAPFMRFLCEAVRLPF